MKKFLTMALIAVFAFSIFGFVTTLPNDSAKADTTNYENVYDFTNETDFANLDMFSVGIDPKDNNDVYTSDSWVTYAKNINEAFTLDGGLKVNTNVYSGDDVSENRIYVRYNVEKYTYFKAELVYSYDNESLNGWAGLVFGYTNYERQARWGDSPSGMEVFMQRDGKSTYSNDLLNSCGYTETAKIDNWAVVGEHTYAIEVTETGVKIYADGALVQEITADEMSAKNYSLRPGSIGFMFTNGNFTAKSFSFTSLDTVVEDDEEDTSDYENYYNFTKATSFDKLNVFAAGIDPVNDDASLGYNAEGWVTYEKGLNELFTLDGGLKVNTSMYAGDGVDNNKIYVRYDAEKYTTFEAELVYTYDDTSRNGWAGIFFGLTNYSRQVHWGDSPNGVEFFVQKEGKATYSSAKLNNSGYTEGTIPNGWVENGEHTLKLVVKSKGITFYADGVETLSVSKAELAEKGFTIDLANIGFMFTNAQFTAKSFAFTPIVEETYVESYDFTTVTDINSVDAFSVGIDPLTNNSDLGYTDESWVTYGRTIDEIFNLNNGLQIDPSIYSGSDVSENNVYVRFNKKQLTYFKAELVYSYDDSNVNGWAGFIIGYTNYTRKARWSDSPYGIELFVQKGGKGTYSSSKLNNSNYTEGTVPAEWTAVGEHTLKVVAIESGITLYADGYKVIEITKEVMEATGYSLNSGNIGFMFTNSQFTAKSFSYSPLNAAGEEYIPVEGIEITAPETVEQFKALELSATVTPSDASLQSVRFALPEGAISYNGKIYFAKPGNYTITAISVDNESVTDEFTVTVTANDKYVAYNPTQENANSLFDNYYVTNGGSKDGALDLVENYWNFNEDGSITLKEKKKNGVDAGYVLLYLKDVVNGLAVSSDCFEINYMVKTSNDTPNGWHGVGFALSDRSTVPNQDGISAFIQEEALKATIWGSGKGGVGGPNEVASAYTRGQWNLVKVRVYGNGEYKIEMYVNDMSTPAISTTAAGADIANNIALFTTTTITLGNIYYTTLNAQGEPIQVIYPESITITNTETNVTVGDRVQLVSQIIPADVTESGLLFSSSDALVASVNGEGLVTFLNAGQTTITVQCKGNPAISTTITFTVKNKEVLPTAIAFDATPTSAEVGGKYVLFVTVTPADATNYDVIYTSSNEAVATVDASGRLNYLSAGETTITVSCVVDPTVKASFVLTVTGGETESTTIESNSNSTQKSGCAGSLGGGFILTLALAVATGVIESKRRSK